MSPRWKDVQNEEEIEELVVKLPVIRGVPPERYLPVAYGAILFVVLSVLLVVPGLTAYGARVTFESVPSGASVYVDDVRIGSAPLTAFFDAGEHEVTAHYPGMGEYRETIAVDGRWFGSLFFPLRRTVEIPLPPAVTTAGIEPLLEDYHEWTLSGTPGPQFQNPPWAAAVGRVLWSSDGTYPPATRENAIQSLLSGASSPQGGEVLSAVLRSSIPGAALHGGQLGKAVQYFIQLDNRYPDLYAAAAEILDGLTVRETAGQSTAISTVGERILSSSWYNNRRDERATAILAASVELDERDIPEQRGFTVDGVSFVRVPAGNYILGYPLQEADGPGVPMVIDRDFFIAATEVTERQFARFLQDEPAWRPSRREELQLRGLVDGDYLSHWPDDGEWALSGSAEATLPVRYVSWYAAAAYTTWLNDRIQEPANPIPGWTGTYRVTLPDAATWEYASYLNDLGGGSRNFNALAPLSETEGRPGALGARHMAGNVWEWSSDWYTTNMRVLPSVYGAQRAVVGGSFVNDPVPPGTTGAQPPEWCTPYLGFRPAIYLRDNE